MTGTSGFSRRTLLGATLASPVVLRHALGDEPIKIGMPCALTGPGGEVGEADAPRRRVLDQDRQCQGRTAWAAPAFRAGHRAATRLLVCEKLRMWWNATGAGCCSG